MEYSMSQYSMLSKMSGGLYVDWWMTAPEEWEVIEYLEKEGLCAVTGDRSFGTWTLTQEGRRVLESQKERRTKDSKQERDRRFNKKISIASVLMPLIVFVLGLVVEHFAGIFGAVLGLFW